MAGVELSLTVDDEEVRRAIAGLAARSLNLREPFEEIGASLVTSTQQRFEDEEDPEGEPWPELAESTRNRRVTKRKLRGSEHILRDRGHLYGSITYLASATEVAVGSNRKYAAIHQLGGTEDMAPGPAAVPARPFLGLSGADEREVAEILLEHLEGSV
jgi:phage virion morphogenesis protein